jgi:uncharacterized protein
VPRPRKARVKTGFDEIAPDDIVALGEFLDREPLAKRSMGIPMLDGFLTAIVIGPEVVMPSDYLPWIWDWKRGKKDVDFADIDEANRILGFLQGMNNRVAGPLMGEPPAVTPVFIFEPGWDHMEWVAGFLMGAQFDVEVWDYARKDAPDLFEPFKAISGMERDAEGWPAACEELSLPLVRIRDYFRAGEWREAFEEVEKPFVREGPKVGRNDPCPCGSGRKFKKCCGETGGAVH